MKKSHLDTAAIRRVHYESLIHRLCDEVDRLRGAIRGTLDDSAKYPQLRLHEMHEERLRRVMEP
jgi:hypothetical protein